MAFNVALSGLNAAQTDLDVKGNNISNASTTGFKRSRAEFGDLYSSGLLNLGSVDTGEGVRVQDTRQLFQQGNVTATSNGLDMAINGEGFFVLSEGGERQFSRAGEFGVDQNGFITNNQGARLQGFQPDGEGNVGDVRGDLEVDTENLDPKRTTSVDANLNLDAREDVLADRFTTFTANGSEVGRIQQPSSSAELPSETWTITDPDGDPSSLTTSAGSAASIAATLSQQDGIVVDASTEATITPANFNPNASDTLTVNGATYDLDAGGGATGTQDLAQKINADPPPGISVELTASDELIIQAEDGENIDFDLGGTGNITIDGELGGSQTIDGANPTATALGVLDFRVDEGYDISEDAGTEILNNPSRTDEVRNAFDPDDSNTYNHSTSSTIYDSLGNDHQLTQYFVKEPSTGPNPSNLWTLYVQVDGENVGSPDPVTGDPTLAQYDLRFNNDGTLDENLSDEVLIDNWTPLDDQGNPNGAAGPNPGGDTPLPNPPQSSNFVVELENSTQVGAEFAINDLQQNGFATGRLSGLDVTDDGVIQARFTNGESDPIGQVALANFRNNEGLAPVGDTAWVETFESGDAVISRPNTGPLGSIQSSSLEESNVDLSEELVGLIVAQRNFQANSKTIETSDQITQTIINLR